jgi:hypothetical protein
MINILNLVLPTLFKKSENEEKVYYPRIKFNFNNEILTERIVYHYEDEEKFYIVTDQDNLLYINDSMLEGKIIYGEPEELIDVSENEIVWEKTN